MNAAKLFPKTEQKVEFGSPHFIKVPPLNNPSDVTDQIDDTTFDKEKLSRMYSYPANYKEAEVHTIASKFGYSNDKLKDGVTEVPVCPCCQNLVATIDIPLSYSTIPGKPQIGRQVFLLPTGASMYFTFIKMVLFFLLIRLIIFDIFNYIASSNGKFCNENPTTTIGCKSRSLLNISGYNLKSHQNQDILNVLDIISLSLTIASIIYFSLVRKRMHSLLSWLDFNQVSQMDFSIIIENVPMFICDENTDKKDAVFQFQRELKKNLEEKILNWFRQLDGFTNAEEIADPLSLDFWKVIYSNKQRFGSSQSQTIITAITLCYDLTEMQNLVKYRDELIEKYLKKDEAQKVSLRNQQRNNEEGALQSISSNKNRLNYFPNQIELLNEQYMKLCAQFAHNTTSAFNLSHFTGKAFISFQYQHYRDYFVRQYQKDNSFVCINEHNIKIRLSSKPQDIYWFNMKVKDSERTKNIFYSYAILLMLLILSFAALMGLQLWKKEENSKSYNTLKVQDFITSNLISVAMAIITNVINTILSSSIELLSNLEQHQTKTQRLNSLITKTILSQALNTSFIYYFLYLIFKDNPLGTYGLVNQVINLVAVSGLISVVLQVFPPTLLYRQLMNKLRYKPQKPINLFQIQLNHALQQPEFNYAAMYSFYIVFSYVVSFYGFIVPSATVIMIVIFFMQYWVDKYNLFRRYSSPVDFGPDLIKSIFKIFEFNVLFHAAGYFFWSFTIHFDSNPSYRAVCISNLSIAFIYVAVTLLLPSRISNKILGEQLEDFDHHTYFDRINKRKFKKTFFRENPATFCFKEVSIDKKTLIPEANDPIFVKQEDFEYYINFKDEDLKIQVYQKVDVDRYQSLNQPNYDEVAAQKALAQQAINNILEPQRLKVGAQ